MLDGARWFGVTIAALLASSSAGCGLLVDLDAPVAEGPAELCNGLDDDADGLIDEDVDGVIAGERVRFELTLSNADTRDVDGDGDRTEPCAPVGDYPLEVSIVADGGALLASQTEIITVR